jgi:hypothetical protein
MRNPKAELEKIMRTYGLGISAKHIPEAKFRKASATDFNGEYSADVDWQLQKNFEKLDQSDLDKIQKIFDNFDFRLYTAYAPLPNKEFLI